MGTRMRPTHGGASFLTTPVTTDEVFAPEGFDGAQRLMADTARAFVNGEVRPLAERIAMQEPDSIQAVDRADGLAAPGAAPVRGPHDCAPPCASLSNVSHGDATAGGIAQRTSQHLPRSFAPRRAADTKTCARQQPSWPVSPLALRGRGGQAGLGVRGRGWVARPASSVPLLLWRRSLTMAAVTQRRVPSRRHH
jgi:hypothetical protein